MTQICIENWPQEFHVFNLVFQNLPQKLSDFECNKMDGSTMDRASGTTPTQSKFQQKPTPEPTKRVPETILNTFNVEKHFCLFQMVMAVHLKLSDT